MPNWCECDLEVEGPSEKVEEFLKFAEGESRFDFNKFAPYPEEYARLDQAAEVWFYEKQFKTNVDWSTRPTDGFNSGGAEFRIEHGGTKWPARRVSEVELTISYLGRDDKSVVIHFDTAWSPPLPVIEKAAELFPMLSFELRYFECGAEFNGLYCCEEGKCVRDECGPYFGNRGG